MVSCVLLTKQSANRQTARYAQEQTEETRRGGGGVDRFTNRQRPTRRHAHQLLVQQQQQHSDVAFDSAARDSFGSEKNWKSPTSRAPEKEKWHRNGHLCEWHLLGRNLLSKRYNRVRCVTRVLRPIRWRWRRPVRKINSNIYAFGFCQASEALLRVYKFLACRPERGRPIDTSEHHNDRHRAVGLMETWSSGADCRHLAAAAPSCRMRVKPTGNKTPLTSSWDEEKTRRAVFFLFFSSKSQTSPIERWMSRHLCFPPLRRLWGKLNERTLPFERPFRLLSGCYSVKVSLKVKSVS